MDGFVLKTKNYYFMIEGIKPMVKDWKFSHHMTFSNGAEKIEKGTIVWPDNPIDGKIILRSICTPRNKRGEWGEGEVAYFLNEDKSPEFKSIEDFIKHYTVPIPDKKEEPILPRVKVKPDAKKKPTGNK
jgi:hypothetical protein